MKRTTEQALEFKVYMSENMVRIGKEHGEWMVGIQPRLKLSASPQTMYLYTFFLNDDYSILCPEEPKIYRPYDPGAHSIDLWSGIQGFGPVASAFGTVGYFKLILTTEDFDHYHLMQSPAFTEQDAQAASSHRSSAPPVTDDWFAVTSRLTVQKMLGTLQKGESLNLLGGNLSLENLAVDKLAVSATHSEQGTASADPAHQFSGLTRAGFHLVTFHGENRKAIANILELRTDQQPTPAENPLLVTIADLPGGLDQVIAIGFNGENFEVIGSAAVTNGSAAIQIRKIPDVNIPASESMVSTPFNTSPVHRSLVEWVKIGLFGIEKDLLDESFRSWDDVSDPFGLLP